jgi:hypothetical protein
MSNTGALFLVTDTNLFLQAKDLAELPWGDVSGKRDVVLIVPRTVQKAVTDGDTVKAAWMLLDQHLKEKSVSLKIDQRA